MILGVGVDVVDLERFGAVMARRPSIVDRVFTTGERAYAEQGPDPVERYAARFAAKEATLKALGVGIGTVGWHDIEVLRSDSGRPSVLLRDAAVERARELGITRVDVALTHSDLVAEAVVIVQGAASPIPASIEVAAEGRLDLVELPIAGGLVPIVTPAEMGIIDAEAPEPVEVLIARAGSAVARAAVEMMGGTYGRRVVVLEGKGNNGNDGRDAARRLRRRGVRVREIGVADAPSQLPAADLVIDAAFGTGFRGAFSAPPSVPGTAVLAVDIPSGVDGLTGEASHRVLAADATVSFAALKPGLVFGDGLGLAGRVGVADIGLDTSRATSHLVGGAAVAGWLGQLTPAPHKWRSAVWIIAGSPGMGGAAALCSAAAARTGAGYVRLSTPGGPTGGTPVETVVTDLPADGWARLVVDDLHRFHAVIVGNGLGTGPATVTDVRTLVAGATSRGLPTVVDADGLTALGRDVAEFVGPATVLTPHDGEFARLAGHPPGADRLAAARGLAVESGAVVLLKGRATVIATPDGSTLVTTTGDQRLATAGTGDVLAGVIGALLAQGLEPGHAAAAGAFLHGRAGALGWPRGLVAGDLPDAMPAALAEVAALRP